LTVAELTSLIVISVTLAGVALLNLMYPVPGSPVRGSVFVLVPNFHPDENPP